jgi:hypothetical protein
LICVATCLTGLHASWNAVIIDRAWKNPNFFQEVRGDWAYRESSRDALLGFLIVSIIVAGGVFLLLLHLVVFHIYLGAKGMSTYDYILKQRAKKAEKVCNVYEFLS